MAIPLANVYSVIAEGSSIADPTKTWRQTIDMYSPTVPAAGDPGVLALSLFFAAMLWDSANLNELRFYNWVLGAPPYPTGLPVLVVPIHTPGTAPTEWVHTPDTAPATGREVVMRIDKEHAGIGKPGRFFIRGLIRASDIQAAEGENWVFVSGTPFNQAHLDDILFSTNFTQMMVGGSYTQKAVVVQASRLHATVSGYQVITGLSLVGVTTNKATRKSSL